jgi:hypothetical protein
VLNTLITHFLSDAAAPLLDRFIGLFNPETPNHIDPLYCEKVFTLDITTEEVRNMMGSVLKTFTLKELLSFLPLSESGLLLEEAAYFVGESVLSEAREWFHIGGHPPASRDRNSGFDFS